MTRVLTLPGWTGSPAGHWQSHWERLDARIVRVEQDDWETPDRAAWVARLRTTLSSAAPTVLVAHSLGAILAVHAAKDAPGVIGALLVAPADVEVETLPASVRTFAPVPQEPLPFPAILVASSNDAYLPLPRARAWASAWGARLVEVGAQGHLNTASQLGTWPEGRALLTELCARAPFALDPRLQRDTHLVGESPSSLLLLMDDARDPWFILVPKRSAVTELFELTEAEQLAVSSESVLLAGAMSTVFRADKMNVGALGNVVRQLHVHHVARRLADPAWPGPVWGHSPRVERSAGERAVIVERLFSAPGLATRFHRA